MSEWSEHRGVHARYYGDGVSAMAWDEGGWRLEYCDTIAEGPECLPFSRDLCDEAAVAYALLLLAKRLAAWAESIDARLAREYRAAVAEHRVARVAWARALEADRAALEPEYQRTARAGFAALDALERGWR